MSAENLLKDIKDDNTHGASEILVKAAECLTTFSDEFDFTKKDEYYSALVGVGKRLIASRPSMAPLFNYVNEVILALEEGLEDAHDVKDQKRQLKTVSSEFLVRSQDARKHIREHVNELIAIDSTILTHSYSQTALKSLVYAKSQGKEISVVATESRPIYEGRETAKVLAQNGIKTTFVADMTAFYLLKNIDMILVGCDTLCLSGIVNKIGTLGLAIAASHNGIPFYSLCEKNKLLPSAYMKKPKIEEKDPDEILTDPKDITVHNIYFDLTPHNLVTGIVMEDGIIAPEDVEKLLTRLKVSSVLTKG
jgi:eIF-2B alpha/beta/delta-like uncharacterized protein